MTPVHRLAAVGDPGPHHVLAGDPVVLVQVRPREAVLGVLLGVIGPLAAGSHGTRGLPGKKWLLTAPLSTTSILPWSNCSRAALRAAPPPAYNSPGLWKTTRYVAGSSSPSKVGRSGRMFVDLQALLDAVDLVLGLVHETAQDRRDVRGHSLQGRIRPGQIVGDLLDLRLDVPQRGDVDRAVLEGRLFVTGQSGVHIVGHVGALEDLQGRVQERHRRP